MILSEEIQEELHKIALQVNKEVIVALPKIHYN